jgi:hypothetical protein
MIPEISTLITSSRTAYDIAKGIGSLKAEVERNEAIAKILEVLISVQTEALAVQSKTQELESEKHALTKKIMEFERWSQTETQYELKEVAPGVFVFSYKVTDNPTKPMHWLCTKCFQEKKAHIIQFAHESAESKRYLCPNCKITFDIPNPNFRSSSPNRNRRRNWKTV